MDEICFLNSRLNILLAKIYSFLLVRPSAIFNLTKKKKKIVVLTEVFGNPSYMQRK